MDASILILASVGILFLSLAVGLYLFLVPVGYGGNLVSNTVAGQRRRLVARLDSEQKKILAVLGKSEEAVFEAAWQSALGLGFAGGFVGYIFGGSPGLALAVPGAIYGWVVGQGSIWGRYRKWSRRVDEGLEDLIGSMPIFLALNDTALNALKKTMGFLEDPAYAEVERLAKGIEERGAETALREFADRGGSPLARSISSRLSLRWKEGLDEGVFDSLRNDIKLQKMLAHTKQTTSQKVQKLLVIIAAIIPFALIFGYPVLKSAGQTLGAGF